MHVGVLRAAPSRSRFKIVQAITAGPRAEHCLPISHAPEVNQEPPRFPLHPDRLPSGPPLWTKTQPRRP